MNQKKKIMNDLPVLKRMVLFLILNSIVIMLFFVLVVSATDITEPQKISSPGVYDLTIDLSSGCGSNACIWVESDGVTINGHSHTITYTYSPEDHPSHGIFVQGSNCVIRDLTIDGFSSSIGGGVSLTHAYNSLDNVILKNNKDGVTTLGSYHTINGSQFSNNINGISSNTNSPGLEIRNNTFSDNSENGIYLHDGGSLNNKIHDNSFKNNQYGIYSESQHAIQIYNNTFTNNEKSAVHYVSSDNSEIFNNIITQGNTGFSLTVSSRENNIFDNSVSEVENAGVSINGASSIENSVHDNNLFNNVYGITLINTKNNDQIFNNTINNNSKSGIYLSGSSSNILSRNSIRNSGQYGTEFYSASYNTLYDNYFNNSVNIYVPYSDSQNTLNIPKETGPNIIGGPEIGGNYWTNPSGNGYSQSCTDSNHDGFCDTPYTPVTGNSDQLPLSQTIFHTITATAGVGGTISPSGAITVIDGDSQTFTITPSDGYQVSDVVVDGSSVGAVETYPFPNVIEDHTISATFSLIPIVTHTITATAGLGGTISPSGSVLVTDGDSQTFTITPSAGYQISDVVVDGSTVGAVQTYLFPNVVADHTIEAIFNQISPGILIPGFTAIPLTGDAPLTVSFIDQSSGWVDGWNWTFGDGDTSDDQNPVHLYETPGIYSPVLLVWNDTPENNATSFITDYIIINKPGPPVADFTAVPPRGNTDMNVTFLDLSTGANLTYAWDLNGDGTTDSTERYPMFEYINGSYDITLTVTDWFGRSDSLTREQYIWTGLPYPQAKFTVTPLYGQAPLNVSCIDQSLLDPAVDDSPVYTWDFDDGSSSSEQNPVHYYADPGEYTISLTIDSNGKSDTYNLTSPVVVGKPLPPKAAYTATPRYGNAPLNVSFIDQTEGYNVSYSWDFGDGSAISHDQNPLHTYETAGSYEVRLTASNEYGVSVSDKGPGYIKILPSTLSAGFTVSPFKGEAPLLVSCIDQSQGQVPKTYLWTFELDGIITYTSPSVTPILTLEDAGTWTVNQTVTDSSGSDSMEKTILVYDAVPPKAGFTATPRYGSAPLNVSFIDQSEGYNISYSWDFGDGSVISHDQNPVHTYENVGSYSVRMTASNSKGVSVSDKGPGYIEIIQPNILAANFTFIKESDYHPLQFQFIDASIGNPVTWNWNFGDGFFSSVECPEHTYSIPDSYPKTYRVILTVRNSADSDTTYQDLIIENPQVTAGFLWEKTDYRTLKFTDASEGIIKTWVIQYGDGATESFYEGEWDSEHRYIQKGIYPVRLVVSNPLYTDSELKKITIS